MGKLVKDMTPEERERRRAYQAAYRAAHREEIRAYYAAHREERLAYDAAYCADNRTRRTNARMARLGFAFADPNAIVAAIGNAVNNNQQTNKKRKVSK